MAFCVRRKDRSIEKGVRRIAREQIDKAISAIDDDNNRVAAVHDVRTRCKKLRGLVRLVRPCFEAYAETNAELRDAARLLSGPRDISVLQNTYDRLAERHKQLDRGSLRRFRHGLAEQRVEEAGADPAKPLNKCHAKLKDVRKATDRWTLSAKGWDAIEPGLVETYEHARAALAALAGGHTPKLHHELRKQVKYHWHHLLLLRRVDPAFVRARIETARQLSDLLGEHHDLAMLDATLRAEPAAFGAEREVETALVLACRHRVLLERKTSHLSQRLLGDKPEHLADRLGSSWVAWWS